MHGSTLQTLVIIIIQPSLWKEKQREIICEIIKNSFLSSSRIPFFQIKLKSGTCSFMHASQSSLPGGSVFPRAAFVRLGSCVSLGVGAGASPSLESCDGYTECPSEFSPPKERTELKWANQCLFASKMNIKANVAASLSK